MPPRGDPHVSRRVSLPPEPGDVRRRTVRHHTWQDCATSVHQGKISQETVDAPEPVVWPDPLPHRLGGSSWTCNTGAS